MANSPSPTKYGRGRREIKKTARFEDLEIPGINSAPNLVRPKQARSHLLSQANGLTSTLRHTISGRRQTTDTMSTGKSDRQTKTNKQAGKDKIAGDSAQVADPASQVLSPSNKLAETMTSTRVTPTAGSSVVTASFPAWKQARSKKRAAPRRQQPQTQDTTEQRARTMGRRGASGPVKTKSTKLPPEPSLDLSIPFTHEKLKIYDWPYPLPSDFLNLHQWQRDWKAKTDTKEAEMDCDPELDDWHELSGRPESYFPLSMKYAIAGSWIKHAKRAFRAGKSWKDFETEERELDSQSQAKEIQDPIRRKDELSWALSNDYRLKIFDLVKVRLCNEIWLEEYVAVPVMEGEKMKKDSLGDVLASAAPPPAPVDNVETKASAAGASRAVRAPDLHSRFFSEMDTSAEED